MSKDMRNDYEAKVAHWDSTLDTLLGSLGWVCDFCLCRKCTNCTGGCDECWYNGNCRESNCSYISECKYYVKQL